MARLIDADRALEIVRDQGIAHPNAHYLTTYATLILREAPTVDAVEVVRCRDCNYYVKFESSLIGEVMCCTGQGSVNIQKQPDDFCSYGEQKGGGGNG